MHSPWKQWRTRLALGSKRRYEGTLSALTKRPPKTMLLSIIAGASALATSGEGATAPTARPSADAVAASAALSSCRRSCAAAASEGSASFKRAARATAPAKLLASWIASAPRARSSAATSPWPYLSLIHI